MNNTSNQLENEPSEGCDLPGYILAEMIYEPKKFWNRIYGTIFKKEPLWKPKKKSV